MPLRYAGQFLRYGLVGVGNTLLHWLVFLALHLQLGLKQAPSNLLAFGVAVTLSYFVNARFTFNSLASRSGFAQFVLVMGALSVLVGHVADRALLSPWVTLLGFSGLSLVLGFLFSRGVVFRRRLP